MMKGFLIYEDMLQYFAIYKETFKLLFIYDIRSLNNFPLSKILCTDRDIFSYLRKSALYCKTKGLEKREEAWCD